MKLLRLIVSMVMLGGLAGCVDSATPLFGPETRAVPFRSATRFEVYSRNHSGQPWRKQSKTKGFVADADNVIRELDDTGKPSDGERYTLHPIGPNYFMLQMEREGRFYYGVVEYRNNELILTMFDCKEIDQTIFESMGGRMSSEGDRCSIDGVKDPIGVLKGLALLANRAQERYVPVPGR